MYIWVVLVAARSFSMYGLVFQLGGILATYGLALTTLTAGPTEFALVTRWLLSVFALCVTGVISLRLVSDSRKKEATLIRMSGMSQPEPAGPNPELSETNGSAPREQPVEPQEEAAPVA
jgi:hypothetical protein